MNCLKPRTIIIAGPLETSLAVFVGHALSASSPTDLKVGMMAAAASILTTCLFSVPLAWAIHWSEQ
jgi:ABC-type sulfate transport system permease component